MNTHTGYVTRQQSELFPPACDIFLFGYDFLIHFQADVRWKPMNLWADDSQECGGGAYSEYRAITIRSLKLSLNQITPHPYHPGR